MPLTTDTMVVVKRLRDVAEVTNSALSFAEVLSQQLAPTSQFDDIVVDSVIWFIGYGIEMQPAGPSRHLSVSHPDGRTLPETEVVKQLVEAFGFDLERSIQRSLTPYQKRGLTLHLMQVMESQSTVGWAT